jgi:hypothetical protein
MDPQDAREIGSRAVEEALARPLGTPPLRELARGRRDALVAIDDLTRPTPVHRILPPLLAELRAGGLSEDRVRIIVGTASHRPPSPDEVAKKLGPELAGRLRVLEHDFLGDDIRRVGWIRGGPVDLSRHYLEADLRICIGAAIPHNETGFGGGAKMVVPGLAGHATIAHFHGALPPRLAGDLDGDGRLDRRAWCEEVARQVGLDAVVCAVVNTRRELAGLCVGDPVEAHRAASRQARELGRTRVPRELAARADAVVCNAYPLDTDPIQMGKSINLSAKLPPCTTVVVNAASDGVFYHGMGMGSGVRPGRLLRNLPGMLASPRRQGTWLRSLWTALPSPLLAARLCYFTLNPLSYADFAAGDGQLPADAPQGAEGGREAQPLVHSRNFPRWGFRRKFPKGRLFREWQELSDALARQNTSGTALVFPCAPLQIVELE